MVIKSLSAVDFRSFTRPPAEAAAAATCIDDNEYRLKREGWWDGWLDRRRSVGGRAAEGETLHGLLFTSSSFNAHWRRRRAALFMGPKRVAPRGTRRSSSVVVDGVSGWIAEEEDDDFYAKSIFSITYLSPRID